MANIEVNEVDYTSFHSRGVISSTLMYMLTFKLPKNDVHMLIGGEKKNLDCILKTNAQNRCWAYGDSRVTVRQNTFWKGEKAGNVFNINHICELCFISC